MGKHKIGVAHPPLEGGVVWRSSIVAALIAAPIETPFSNDSKWGAYNKIKIFVGCFTLLPVRFVIVFVLALLLLALLVLSGMAMEETVTRPRGRLLRFLLTLAAATVRAALFAMGFYYIPEKGVRAGRHEAPIILPKHQGFMDPFLICWAYTFPAGAAKKELQVQAHAQCLTRSPRLIDRSAHRCSAPRPPAQTSWLPYAFIKVAPSRYPRNPSVNSPP
jgi:hypothetical protein